MLLLGINLSAYQSIIVDINKYFGFDGASAGIFIALFFLGSLIAPAVAGELSDRMGKRVVLIFSAVVFIAGLVLVSQAWSIATTGAGVLLIGAASCTIEGLLSAKITDENPQGSEKLMNFTQLFFCVGAVMGPLLSLAVKSLGADWQVLMLVIAALFVPASISLFFIPVDKISERKIKTKEKSYSLTLIKDIKFLFFFFSMLLYVGAEAGVAFSVTGYYADIGHSFFTGEIALSLFWAGMILGRFVSGLLHKHSNKIMIVCLAASFTFSLLLQFRFQSTVSTALFFLLGLSFSAIWPLLMAFCTQAFSKFSGTAGGLMVVGGSIGGMTLPMLMGVITNMAGAGTAMVVSTCAMFIALVLYLMSRNKTQRN